VASFPSVTGYSFYPMFTGRDAVSSGVDGLRYFHRRGDRGNFRNYLGRTNVNFVKHVSSATPTLFELFGDQHSFCLNTYANKGCRRVLKLGYHVVMADLGHAFAIVRIFAIFLSWVIGWCPITQIWRATASSGRSET